jgi:AraC-like DNA-binding protein
LTRKSDAHRILASPPDDDFVGAIREVLRLYGGHKEWLGLADMAKMAKMCVRSFQRRLNAEGIVYSDLVDDVRAEMATDMLENSDAPLSDLAERLGYANQGNFSRAYHRWTGRNPSEVRANA